MKNRRSPRQDDPAQLELFGDLQREDVLIAYYRKLRAHGADLSLDQASGRIDVHRVGSIPEWMVKPLTMFHARIAEDLLRVEHGVIPADKPEALEGGAVLHRLPGPRPKPELDPPTKPPRPATRRDPRGAA